MQSLQCFFCCSYHVLFISVVFSTTFRLIIHLWDPKQHRFGDEFASRPRIRALQDCDVIHGNPIGREGPKKFSQLSFFQMYNST
jgi:hypothetical protein